MPIERWLGYRRTPPEELPVGWELKRLRDLARSFKAGGGLGLTMSDYVETGFDSYSAEGLNGKTSVAEFDGPAVIVSSIGSKCGKCFFAPGKFTTLANVQVVFPDEAAIDPYFLWLVLNDESFWPRAQTGQPFIRPADIKKAWTPKPPEPEQKGMRTIFESVARALTAAETKLVAARRLKTALMQQLFTRGLPGCHTKFKETKWFTAPASWKPRRLRDIAKVEAGFTMGRDLSRHETVEVHYLTVVNVLEGGFNLADTAKVEVKVSELDDLLLKPRDILMTEGGDRDKLGRGGIWRGEVAPCVYQNHIFRVRFEPNTYQPELFHFLIQSWHARNYFQAHAKQTSNLCSINSRELKAFSFFEPDQDEQLEMVRLLTAAEEQLHAVEAEIATLESLKRSLLQNLITGRVRVRIEP